LFFIVNIAQSFLPGVLKLKAQSPHPSVTNKKFPWSNQPLADPIPVFESHQLPKFNEAAIQLLILIIDGSIPTII
jgi:hypothetical protein